MDTQKRMKIDKWYRENAERYDLPNSEIPHRVPLLPFVDENYFESDSLKVMHLGINAYVGERDWADAKEDSWRGWARNDRYKFHKWMSKNQAAFSNFSSASYRTNLVKIFLPASTGKIATDVSQKILDKSQELLKDEIKLLQHLQVLPDIILCYGRKAWDGMWPIMFNNFNAKDLAKHRAFTAFIESKEVHVFQISHSSSRRRRVDAYKIVGEYREKIMKLKNLEQNEHAEISVGEASELKIVK